MEYKITKDQLTILHKLAKFYEKDQLLSYKWVFFRQDSVDFYNGHCLISFLHADENKNIFEDDTAFSYDSFIALCDYVCRMIHKKATGVSLDYDNEILTFNDLAIKKENSPAPPAKLIRDFVEVNAGFQLFNPLNFVLVESILKIFGCKELRCYQKSVGNSVYLNVNNPDFICVMAPNKLVKK